MAQILIVNDGLDIKNTWKQFLEYYGHDVVVANHGQAGIDSQQQTAQVIIADIARQKMNGIELIKKLKPKYPGTKFIVISGAGLDMLAEARHAGANCTLQKPFSGHLLAAAVNSLIKET